jgi:uncharacterized protein YjbJ (UPF0337 family)
MSASDKIKNTAQGAIGMAKEAAGTVGRSTRMAQRGRRDQMKADLKNAAEHLRDASSKLREMAKY